MGSSELAGLPLIHPANVASNEAWAQTQSDAAANAEFGHRYGEAYELVIVKSPCSEHFQPVFTHFPQLKEYGTRNLFS